MFAGGSYAMPVLAYQQYVWAQKIYFVQWKNYPLKNSNKDRLAEKFLTFEHDKSTPKKAVSNSSAALKVLLEMNKTNCNIKGFYRFLYANKVALE